MQHAPLGVIMAQIKQLQSRTIEKMLKKNDGLIEINGAQINILYQLWLEDNITISELSKRTQLANTTLTTMLDRLETQGQIQKIRNLQNRREIRIKLTAKSSAAKSHAWEILNAMHAINFNGFTEEEETLMYSFLERIKNNLENVSL